MDASWPLIHLGGLQAHQQHLRLDLALSPLVAGGEEVPSGTSTSSFPSVWGQPLSESRPIHANLKQGCSRNHSLWSSRRTSRSLLTRGPRDLSPTWPITLVPVILDDEVIQRSCGLRAVSIPAPGSWGPGHGQAGCHAQDSQSVHTQQIPGTTGIALLSWTSTDRLCGFERGGNFSVSLHLPAHRFYTRERSHLAPAPFPGFLVNSLCGILSLASSTLPPIAWALIPWIPPGSQAPLSLPL